MGAGPGTSVYGLPAPVATAPSTGGTAAATAQGVSAGGPQSAGTRAATGFHQDPVLLLCVVIFVAYLLIRGAEHGVTLGFKARASAS